MESLFRFMLARPAQLVDVASTTEVLRTSPDYEQALVKARASESPVVAVRRAAAQYRKASSGGNPETKLPYFGPAIELRADLLELAPATRPAMNKAFTARIGVTAAEFVTSTTLARDTSRLADLIVTAAILASDTGASAADMATVLGVVTLARRLAANDATLEEPGAIAALFSRTLALPSSVFPLMTGVSASPQPPAPPAPDAGKTLAALEARRKTLTEAYTALIRITPDQIAPPAEPRGPARAAAPATPARIREGAKRVDSGSTRMPTIAATPLVLRADAVSAFEPAEQAALRTLKIDPTKTSVTAAAVRLNSELMTVEQSIAVAQASANVMTRLGDRYYPNLVLAGSGSQTPPAPPPASLPMTHGSIAPAGIGDLLVVKQNLKRYEAREESHIENILKGESKKTVHTRMDLTETTTTVEDDLETEEDRDQQTTERFELSSESANTIKSDSSLKAGVAISGSYGPVVDFKATTDFATSTSKEESTKVGTKFSKDVTTRATSKIITKHRQEVVTHLVTKVREKNVHGIDNTHGTGPVVGQYQWVDKIYEAQVFNYGKRLLYDLMVPEPAAFLLYASSRPPSAQSALIKPDPFTLSPLDITETNYPFYVNKYSVVGVTPPPAPYVTSSKAIDGKGDRNDDGIHTKTEDVPIPDGYSAISAAIITWFYWFDDSSKAFVDIVFGRHASQVTVNAGGGWFPNLSNETGTITFAALTAQIDSFVTNIDVTCQRMSATLDAWKLKTHAAILQAYQQQLRDYNDALAALQMQAGQQLQGRNPETNERMIRTELKKGAISLFTAQQFDWLNAIQTSPQGFPEIQLDQAALEGPYIRFFEEAFEWEQMVYFFYPYFWGRKANWLDRALLDDVDPLFADFVRAGSARCMVPVRPGFEAAVGYFMQTGQIWNGGDLPTLADPLYVSLIEEIRERDQAPGDEVPQGDPWDVRLPTSLIYLRPEDTLPSWHKDADGNWIPD